ncbi:MAG: diacylglycerol kinase [Meiothermus silvanus]|uniref:diacylglycerol kinase n=1 Tax=Allomeiothermus silvanus TaxID=52022 RepID=UPI00236AB203|nr:diacylglycerol kinase [Allomeiothermus silvanus]MCL6569406.1 diacylglycerol kinase [Allomeiothermus silvanus]
MGSFPPRPGADPNPIKGLRASFGYAFRGLRYAWRSQRNFRIESYIAALALALSLWLGVGLLEVLFLILIVLSLELLNTALEAVVDLTSPTYHPLAKAAKDTAAAAVLISSLLSGLIGLILLGPPLLDKLER